MTNSKDTLQTQLDALATAAVFRVQFTRGITNYRGDGWRLALTWDADKAPASVTAYHQEPGQGYSQVADAILAEQHPGGGAWLFDVLKRFFESGQYQGRLELLADAAIPASDGPVTRPAMTGGDQPHPDRGNALELLEAVSADIVREDEQRHVLAVAEQANWMVHDYPVGSDWDKAYLAKMNLGLKGFFDKVYRFTSADTADVVSVFFLRHQVYGAHLDSPGRQAFRSRGDNRSPWITDTVARWLVNPTDTLADGRSNHDLMLEASQADQIPDGSQVTMTLDPNQIPDGAAGADRWARLQADVDAASVAIGVPLAPADPAPPMTELDAALADNVRKLAQPGQLPRRTPGEFWPTVTPEPEHRARHLAADMFTSYWDGRDADMFDADDVTAFLELLEIARRAGR